MPAPVIKHRYTDFGADKNEVQKFSVKYKDVFSFGYFYTLLHEWMVENDYATRSDEDFKEVFYLQRDSPTAGKELWVRWRCSKIPSGTESKLWRYDIDVDVHVLGMREVEFVYKGQKLRADKGEVEVSVVANLIVDYEKAWGKHAWLKNYKNFLLKKVFKKQKEFHENELNKDAEDLQVAIKSYLKLETYLPAIEQPKFWKTRVPE